MVETAPGLECMRQIRHLFQSIPTGCRGLISFLALLAIATMLLPWLLSILSLSGPEFWHGQVWRLFTYGAIPANLIDLIMNGILIGFIGSWVESRSNRWTVLGVCLAGIVGAGLVRVLVQPHNPGALLGLAPMGFALLAAWIKLCGWEEVVIIPNTSTKVWVAGSILSALSLASAFFSCSPVDGLIIACAWPAGWAFLWGHDRYLRSRMARSTNSNRISRLEI